jgi:hypothetical protein
VELLLSEKRFYAIAFLLSLFAAKLQFRKTLMMSRKPPCQE